MSELGNDPPSYVQKAREETHRYLLEVLEDNQKLRRCVASLGSERTLLREEKLSLQEQTLALREELERQLDKQQRLARELSQAEDENHLFSERFVEIEEHNNNLACLYVASYRLHETVDRSEVLTALQEIIINLIGSEEFVILESEPTGGGLSVAASFGVDQERIAGLELESGPIGRTIRSGAMSLAEQEPEGFPDELLACIPLKLGPRVHGVIVIFRLLAHKRTLEPLDYELFDLLASHAASSLYVSKLHDLVGDGAGVAA